MIKKGTFVLLMIFAFVAKSQLVPTDKLALLKGIVTDFQGKPIPREIIIFENSIRTYSVKITADANGKFEVLVPVNATYDLRYKNFTVDMNYSRMQIPADKEAVYEVEIRIDPPKEIVLDNIYFDTGKSTLKPASNKSLNDLVEVLKIKSTMVIEIQGHTDNDGSLESNMSLSQARAEAVKKYLVSKGIADKRVQAKGYGPTRPVADNATEAGKSKNRRTGLKVLSQ